MRAGVHLAALAALIWALPGCRSGVTDIGCTRMGCYGGLDVRIVGSLPEVYSVLAYVDNLPPYTIECGPENPCACWGEPPCQGVFFPEYLPERVTIEVRAEGLLGAIVNVSPEYVELRPNGPGCPPPCPVAEVVVQVA